MTLRSRFGARGAVAIAAVLGVGTAWGLVAHSTQHPLGDDAGLYESMNIDASLRSAVHLAVVPGLKDRSLEWLPKQHLVSSSGGSVTSSSITAIQFDFATGTYCIAASNGHRITNSSRGVEPGTCEVPPPAEGGMTSMELALARDFARVEIARDRATVTSATVTADDKGVFGSTTALACTSRRILHITLIGSFPGIAISPAMSDPDPTPRAVRLAVDGKSGRLCDAEVVVREVHPARGAVVLHLG